MAGELDFLERLRQRQADWGLNSGGNWALPQLAQPGEPPAMPFMGEQVDPSQLTPEQLAQLTGQMPEAAPNEGSGLSAFETIFDILDIPGAFVRGTLGAGIEAAKGNLGAAGKSFLGGLPGSEAIPYAINKLAGTNIPELRAPTGEDLLVGLGMPKGSTAEDERRVRIARAAGVSEAEARRKFGKAGEKLDKTAQQEFDSLMRTAVEGGLSTDDLGVTWADTKKAADLGDVAGIAVDIATDPLTYVSFGATGVGKAAKALESAEKLAPGLKALVKGSATLDDALRALHGTKLPTAAKERLAGLLGKAWKSGKPELELGANLSQRAALGQTGLVNLPGGKPLIKGQAAFDWLSTIGETRMERSLGKNIGAPGNTVTEGIRSLFQGTRELFSNRTGIKELDALLESRKAGVQEGVTTASRELDRLNQEIRRAAEVKGLSELETKKIVQNLVESKNFSDAELGPIAAGIAKINDTIAAKAKDSKVAFEELDDAVLGYMRREITPEGKKWVSDRKNAAKFAGTTGAEYSARTSSFMARTEKWKGMTIADINKALGFKMFYEDPIWTTRRMVRNAQRAIANATFGEGVIKQFGEAAQKGDKTAEDIYKSLGMKLPDAGPELDALRQMAVPQDVHDFVVRAAEFQKNPGPALKAWRSMTDWMKATVTVLFPAFHGRNLLEGFTKSTLEGNTNPRNFEQAVKFLAAATNVNSGGGGKVDALVRGAKKILQSKGSFEPELKNLFRENGIGSTLEEVLDWMTKHGVLENRITSEFGIDLAEEGARSGVIGKAKDAAGALFGRQGAPIRAGMALSSRSDNMFRVSMLIDRLKKGYLPDEAVAEVKKVFFDYRDLTKVESDFAKNFGFFYNFYRNNLRYIAQFALEHPEMNKQLMQLFRDDPDNPRFRWLSQVGALKLGAADVSLGFLPQGQFSAFNLAEGDAFDKLKGKLGQGIGMMNPTIVNGLDLAFGKDLFTNTPLEYKTRIADLSSSPEWFQKAVGFERTTTGEGRISWKTNFLINAVPALGRMLQSTLAWDAKDKDYVQKLSRAFLGVGITKKDISELNKRDLELVDRNIEREAKSLKHVRETGKATYAVDTATREGKILAALAFPNNDRINDLFLDPEIGARLAPYVTMKGDKPVMNRLLRDAIDELFREKFPDHAALFDAQRLRKKLRVARKDEVELEADELFASLFGENQ